MSRFEELVEVARAQMEEFSVPGASLGVFFDGEEETAALGVTSIEHPLDVTPDTLFQIGSITKTFTATAIMRLVERGDVDLDAPVRTYLPEFRLSDEDVAARATIRQLLTHTGGWLGDYFADFGRGADALAGYVEAIADQPQLAPLGEVWSYNNSAFNIAGRVIETVTDKSYEDALRELVLDPLGIEQAYFFADEVITYRFAVGHERRRGGEDRPRSPVGDRALRPSRRRADHVRPRVDALRALLDRGRRSAFSRIGGGDDARSGADRRQSRRGRAGMDAAHGRGRQDDQP